MSSIPRRALVTGGSGDLGAAICRALAADGLHVIVHANQGLARAQAIVMKSARPAAARRQSRSTWSMARQRALRSKHCWPMA